MGIKKKKENTSLKNPCRGGEPDAHDYGREALPEFRPNESSTLRTYTAAHPVRKNRKPGVGPNVRPTNRMRNPSGHKRVLALLGARPATESVRLHGANEFH